MVEQDDKNRGQGDQEHKQLLPSREQEMFTIAHQLGVEETPELKRIRALCTPEITDAQRGELIAQYQEEVYTIKLPKDRVKGTRAQIAVDLYVAALYEKCEYFDEADDMLDGAITYAENLQDQKLIKDIEDLLN